MDFYMRQMNGDEASQKITKICKKMKIKQPVIACVSAYEEEVGSSMIKDTGMKAHINKPFTQETLYSVFIHARKSLKNY